MTDVTKPEKAELREMDADFKNEKNKEKWTKVQFNPETLKVTFANQLVSPDGGGDKTGPAPRQFVGAGTTKLSLQIWFDITVPQPDDHPTVDDVRKLTQRVAYFITPKQDPPGSNTFIPPAIRFVWGSFQFDGLMDSLEESLEFFSNDGRPLRASMNLSLSQQKIQEFVIRPTAGQAGSGGGGLALPSPGTSPLTPALANTNLPNLAASLGKGGDWQGIAAANGIENPRILTPGQLIDMNVSVSNR
jgi:hypothetical protein